MKAVALFGAYDLRLVEIEDDILGGHDVRAAISRVGICGSDIHFFAHGRVGAFELNGPIVIGHEAAGVVLEVGPAVKRVRVGDRIAIEPGRPCAVCESCMDGSYNLCPDMAFPGLPPNPGYLAERVVIPERCAHVIPDEMTLDEAALLEPLSVALWAFSRVPASVGESVLIAGAGPIGVLLARVAQASGMARVAVVDVDSTRLAELAGRTRIITEDVSDGWSRLDDNYETFFECTGADGVLFEGLKHVRRRGRAVVVGIPSGHALQIPAVPMRFREISVTCSFRYASTWPKAIAAVSQGIVPVRDIVSSVYGLEESQAAFEASVRHEAGLKAMFRVNGND